MDEQKFHVGVKALITNSDGQILLMHEDGSTHRKPMPNYWDLPGGRMQEGELVLNTLQREVKEETGITTLTDVSFVTAVISNHRIPLADGTVVGLVLMVYRVLIPENATIKLSDEHIGYEWVATAEARARLTNKYPAEFTDSL